MPSPLAARVARTIRRRALFGDGDRVAIAVSGGADSTALACLLPDLAPRAAWRVAGLVHVNHGLRGAESDGDEAFCVALADRLTLPIHAARVQVRARRGSVETAAREARYACFREAAAALGATVVTTAHTIDDQAETVLMRLLRGAGSRGLSAIRPRLGLYARPLIDCRRAELRAELQRRRQAFREDSSNRDLTIPRNRLRATLLPLVEADWPGGIAALARLADLAAEDDRYLEAAAAEAAQGVVQSGPAGVQVNRGQIAGLPVALARRVMRSALEAAGGEVTLEDVDVTLGLAGERNGTRRRHLDLAGLSIDAAAGWLSISRSDRSGRATRALAEAGAGRWEGELDVPGSVRVPGTGVTITATRAEGEGPPFPAPRHIAVLQADAVSLPLRVRYRRVGDRLRPFGAPGSRKLQDLLVDRKIPRAHRDFVPVVVDAAGRIVWVAGLAIGHEYRVTTPRSAVVILEMKKGRQ